MILLCSIYDALLEFMRNHTHNLWPDIVGYGFAVVAGHFFVKMIVSAFWNSIEESKRNRPNPHLPEIVGFVERILYVASLQMGKPEFIGVWLALKVAGQWNRWGIDTEGKIPGRAFYNGFLVGNAMNILYALVGAGMITWFSCGDYYKAVIIATCLILLSLCIRRWFKSYKIVPKK